MRPVLRGFAMALMLASATLAHAQQPSGQGVDSNPYNSPIKRANPNSRQGTAPNTPQTAPTPGVRPPTLENGGVGNGQPSRQQIPVPPAGSPRFDPPARETPAL